MRHDKGEWVNTLPYIFAAANALTTEAVLQLQKKLIDEGYPELPVRLACLGGNVAIVVGLRILRSKIEED